MCVSVLELCTDCGGGGACEGPSKALDDDYGGPRPPIPPYTQ